MRVNSVQREAVTLESISALPRGSIARPVMRQSWMDLSFIHWSYDPKTVQALLPSGLKVDTFGGDAWVGLIGFRMEAVRFSKGPTAGYFSNFPEINVRTYVIDPLGRRDVWFFSLDIDRYPPVAVAQAMFGLPYRWGSCALSHVGEHRIYSVKRRSLRRSGARTRFVVKPRETIAPTDETSLERFLTARWGMTTMRRGELYHGAVDHPRWPLQRATLVEIEDTLVTSAGLPEPQGAPIVHYSTGVEVKIAKLELTK
ncbi:MAG: DUF2071 domain-containing protein [Acidimicrobiales bacterium]